ncbi:MAG: ABC transporter substrate-binding protein [Chloroflexota bacterium]
MRRIVAILGAAMLVAISCSPSTSTGPAASAATSAKASEKPVEGGIIVVGSTSDPKTMQPVIATDTASSDVWSQFYLGLTRTNRESGETEGNLAVEAPKLSADGLTLTYTLRDGLVWSDGTAFTGEDYKYTVEAVMRSKKTVRKSSVNLIAGAVDYADGKTDSISGIKVDGKTITITLSKIFCPAIAGLGSAGGGILPSAKFKAVWDNKTTDTSKNIDDNPLNNNPPASMGPFIFKSFTPGQQVIMDKNPKYFRGAPHVDQYIIKNYADATAIKNALITGEITFGGVEAKDYDEVGKTATLSPYRFKSLSYNYIAWNAHAAKAPWLANKDVRQALWYGIDVDSIVKKLLFGYGTKALAHTPPVSWAYDPAGLTDYKLDPAKSKALLEKAGAKMGTDGIYRWTDGSPMKMRIETNQGNNTRETILSVAQEQYKAIGIQIDPLLESFNQLLDRTVPGTDWEGNILGWSLGADPDPFSIWDSSQSGKDQFNNVFYNSPAVDAALKANREGPDCSKAARKSANHTLDLNLNQDAPYTFLFSGDTLGYSQKSLQNFQPFTFSRIWNIEQWWIKK